MENNEFEDIFADIDKTKVIPQINQELLKDYVADPTLFKRDKEQGFLTEELANIYEKAILENENIFEEELDQNTREIEVSKKLVKANTSNGLKKNIELGFIEPILLSLVVSLLGLIYVGYLYLIV